MKPEAIFRCTQGITITNCKGQQITLEENVDYFKTSGPDYIYLNRHDQPTVQLPWLDENDFNAVSPYLLKVSDA